MNTKNRQIVQLVLKSIKKLWRSSLGSFPSWTLSDAISVVSSMLDTCRIGMLSAFWSMSSTEFNAWWVLCHTIMLCLCQLMKFAILVQTTAFLGIEIRLALSQNIQMDSLSTAVLCSRYTRRFVLANRKSPLRFNSNSLVWLVIVGLGPDFKWIWDYRVVEPAKPPPSEDSQ